ncbi:wax ester/triacylglycerol synthase domain-containing protein, partial [Vibrio parahaemolyticus]
MHVGCLQIFSLPDDAPADFIRDTLAALRRDAGLREPFSLKLAPGATGVALKSWVTEHAPDMAYHVTHLTLPARAGEQQLVRLISQLQG